MSVLQKLSKNKARVHRAILVVQVVAPLAMFAGAMERIPPLIVFGLIALVIANLLAIITA